MSFTGTLDDFSPVEIISVLDILQKSGKLRLARGDEEGLVIFRGGKIIYAAASGFRENLGTMLLTRGLVDEGQLVEALGLQVASTEEKRLGNLLMEMGALSQEDLNGVILEQVIQTVSQFGHWDSGEFDFSAVHVEDHGEVELQSGDLWSELGLSPNHVLLRLAQAMDETSRESCADPAATEPPPRPQAVAPAADDVASEPLTATKAAPSPEPVPTPEPASMEEPAAPAAPDALVAAEAATRKEEAPRPAGMATLKDFVGEVRGPQVKGELVHKLLEQAGQVFGRCLIFSVRQDGFRSIAQTGQLLPRPAGGSQLLDIALGRKEPSLLSRCASAGHTVMARLPQDESDAKILDPLGGSVDEKSVAMPLAVKGETVLILYGDSLLQELPLGWAENLEGFLSESGQKIEADIQAEIAAEIATATSS
jgi:hypothetical protein